MYADDTTLKFVAEDADILQVKMNCDLKNETWLKVNKLTLLLHVDRELPQT